MDGFNPGDVIINQCMIGGAGGSVDISKRIVDFSIFESMMKPYTSIDINFIDNTDLFDNIGITGNNALSLSFNQPGQDSYVGNWTITSIEKTERLQNQRAQMYRAVGYSPHMTSFQKVQKTYSNVPATSAAADLIQTFLNPAKGLHIGAPAMGMVGTTRMPWQISGLQIHKAIKNTLQQAASTVDASSAYTFFENQFNMVIDTLEHMQNSPLGAGPTFYQRPMGQNFLQDVGLQPFIILALEEESRVDSTSTSQFQNQASNVWDMFSSSYTKGATKGASSYLNIPYDMMAAPSFALQFLAKRQKIAAQFDQQSATVLVSLQTGLTVGYSFNIETLAPLGDTDNPVLDSISGQLLCTEIRHMVKLSQKRMQGTTVAKGVKGSAGLTSV